MNEASFYSPIPSHDEMRFSLPVVDAVCVGPPERQFMMGGVGLGSAITALERATGRPLIWATAQYLSFAQPGSVVDIDAHVPVQGKSISQARVVSHVGDREIITVNAALGVRPEQPTEQYVEMPDVPAPDTCPIYEPDFATPGDLQSRTERRSIPGKGLDHPGHARMWVRALGDEPITSGLLAVFADFLPGAIPMTRGSSSLDNTLRVRSLDASTWCLLDARIHGLASGFFHGEMCLFSEAGVLLATASQSGALPRRD